MEKVPGNDAVGLHARVEGIMIELVLELVVLPMLVHVRHGGTAMILRATAPGSRPSAVLAARDSTWPLPWVAQGGRSGPMGTSPD